MAEYPITRTKEDLAQELSQLRESGRSYDEKVRNLTEENQRLKQDAFADRDEIQRLKGALKAAHLLLDTYLAKDAR